LKEINLAAVITTKRREKGITQDELAAHVGVSKQSVCKWEKGYSYPDIILLPKLAAYFDISIDCLMGYEPQMAADDIRKLNIELLNDFAAKPFDEAMTRCRSIIKKNFSCYPLLFQVGLLFVNYGAAAKDEVLRESKKAETNILIKTITQREDAQCTFYFWRRYSFSKLYCR